MRRPGTEMSAFGVWLWNRRISDRAFAQMMRDELQVEKFSKRTVEQWRYGKRIPRGKNMVVIKKLTGITADSFLEGVSAGSSEQPKKNTEPE